MKLSFTACMNYEERRRSVFKHPGGGGKGVTGGNTSSSQAHSFTRQYSLFQNVVRCSFCSVQCVRNGLAVMQHKAVVSDDPPSVFVVQVLSS